jgi:hypothetical protein
MPPLALPYAALGLSPIELNLLLPQHLIRVEGVLSEGGVSHHLVEVLLSGGLSLVLSVLRSALTLARALSESPAFSSRAKSASSLLVHSTSLMRRSSCNSSTTATAGVTTAGLGGGGGEEACTKQMRTNQQRIKKSVQLT